MVQWRSGYRSKIDADTAYQAIEKIRKGGGVTPEKVVEVAEKPTNPLHEAFTWDNEEAATQHRLHEARLMLRSFVVVREESPKHPSRVYETKVVTVKTSDGTPATKKVYTTVEQILEDPDTRAELLAQAFRELASARRKYSQLSELSNVWKAIDRLELAVV